MYDTLDDLIRHIVDTRCETRTVEVKSARNGAPRVHDSLSSFSNQNDGGVIVFGIDESAGYEICGVYDPQDLQRNIHGQCTQMTPEVRPVFDTTDIDGKTVVVAFIPGRPMSERPVYQTARGIIQGSYVRIGDADAHMTPVELYEIESFKNGRRDDIATETSASTDMLDETALLRLVDEARRGRPLLSRRPVDEVMNLIGVTHDGKPTLAGLLSVGDYPQQVYPNLCVTAVAVAGTDLGTGADGERFLDNKRFEGTVEQMVEGAMGFVARNSRTTTVIRDGRRTDVPQYPETAVREILVNALMHRDYGPYCKGTQVRLTLFSDRLECWNPGGVYGGQNVSELGYANSQIRNPTLVSLLEIQHIAENRHSGIPVIRDEARAIGAPEPEFVDSHGSFLVRFRCAPARDAAERQRIASDATTAVRPGHAPDDSRKHHPAGRNDDAVLRFCAVPRSAQDIAEFCGLSTAYVRRTVIRPMIASGKLRMTIPDKPRSKRQRYVSGMQDSDDE